MSNDTRTLADAIAAHMPGWHAESPHDHGARLVNDATGARLWLRVETYGAKRGRLAITGGRPDAANYSAGDTHGIDAGEITVDPARGADVVAREITRRLVPTALAAWREVSDRIARREAALSARETLARELAGIMGTHAREWRDDWRADLPDALTLAGAERATYGELVPDYDGATVTVSLRGLPADRARQLAALIATWAHR